MIVGFNHNVTYRSVNFHVQTEDSGLKSPHLVTLPLSWWNYHFVTKNQLR